MIDASDTGASGVPWKLIYGYSIVLLAPKGTVLVGASKD